MSLAGFLGCEKPTRVEHRTEQIVITHIEYSPEYVVMQSNQIGDVSYLIPITYPEEWYVHYKGVNIPLEDSYSCSHNPHLRTGDQFETRVRIEFYSNHVDYSLEK